MNKTSRQKWSIHSFGTGESVAEVLNLLLTFCSSSMSEFPEMLKKDTNWDQDFGTKMELLFLFVSGNITLAKSFSQFDAGMSLMFTRCLSSPSMMTTGTTSIAFSARFDRGLCWGISSESRIFRLFYLCWIFPLETIGIIWRTRICGKWQKGSNRGSFWASLLFLIRGFWYKGLKS